MKLAYAFCGSFCTHARSLAQFELLCTAGNLVFPAVSEIVLSTTTRFGSHEKLLQTLQKLSGNSVISDIKSAEEVITHGNFDAVIVSPCTGNTAAKIAHGITDGTVTMCVKAQLRSEHPVLLGLATNDGLGANLKNIGLLTEKKNIWLIPFGQDDSIHKPCSLVCDFSRTRDALAAALRGKQLQPLLS